MKRVDFENGTVTGNILEAALPMLVAQILNLLYNIVDRIYIARIPEVGTAALGAVGLCFPLIVIITAFANLFGNGGAPLFAIQRGQKDERKAVAIMDTSFTMVCASAIVLMVVGFLFARPILILFGASDNSLVYALPYMMIYLLGTLPSMVAVGMNPFINAQGIFADRYVFGSGGSRSQSAAGSIIYLWIGIWCARGCHCNCAVSVPVGNICILFSYEKIRIESTIAEEE